MLDAFSFPRSRRLLRPAEFQRLFKGADWRIAGTAFTLLVKPNSLGFPRLGIALSKRNVRHAVDRNCVRRQVRESFRMHQQQLNSFDVVFLARSGIDALSNHDLRVAVDRSWLELAKRCKKS